MNKRGFRNFEQFDASIVHQMRKLAREDIDIPAFKVFMTTTGRRPPRRTLERHKQDSASSSAENPFQSLSRASTVAEEKIGPLVMLDDGDLIDSMGSNSNNVSNVIVTQNITVVGLKSDKRKVKQRTITKTLQLDSVVNKRTDDKENKPEKEEKVKSVENKPEPESKEEKVKNAENKSDEVPILPQVSISEEVKPSVDLKPPVPENEFITREQKDEESKIPTKKLEDANFFVCSNTQEELHKLDAQEQKGKEAEQQEMDNAVDDILSNAGIVSSLNHYLNLSDNKRLTGLSPIIEETINKPNPKRRIGKKFNNVPPVDNRISYAKYKRTKPTAEKAISTKKKLFTFKPGSIQRTPTLIDWIECSDMFKAPSVAIRSTNETPG